MLYYGPVNETDHGPVEICWAVDGQPTAGREIQLREIPEYLGAVGPGSKASCKFTEILEVWDDVLSWVQN